MQEIRGWCRKPETGYRSGGELREENRVRGAIKGGEYRIGAIKDTTVGRRKIIGVTKITEIEIGRMGQI